MHIYSRSSVISNIRQAIQEVISIGEQDIYIYIYIMSNNVWKYLKARKGFNHEAVY